jgi:hypothetical protein
MDPAWHNVVSQETPVVEDAKATLSARQDAVSVRARLDPGLKLQYFPQGIKRDQRPLYDVVMNVVSIQFKFLQFVCHNAL